MLVSVIPYDASSRVLTWIRTAGRSPPARVVRGANALDLRELLRQLLVGDALDLGERHGVGGERQRDDRRVGGIDLGVDRRRRQIGRQQTAGRVDRRLHFLLSHVEAEVEIELQGDPPGRPPPEKLHRRHPVQVGHLTERALQRRGDGLRHHLGAAARVGRLHLDGRIIDLGQGRQRQEVERHQPGQQHGQHQQRSRHWPQNERAGRIHDLAAAINPGSRRLERRHRSVARALPPAAAHPWAA